MKRRLQSHAAMTHRATNPIDQSKAVVAETPLSSSPAGASQPVRRAGAGGVQGKQLCHDAPCLAAPLWAGAQEGRNRWRIVLPVGAWWFITLL
ncbi:MAG: hypothetical protein OQK05_03265 [Pseudopelagicola sp.]|nr:hypothetical protein [Pseudopelagicola sp.]